MFRWTSGEDGRVGGSQAHLILWLHLRNSHISINKKENVLKTDKTDSPHEEGRKGKDAAGAKVTCGSVRGKEGCHRHIQGKRADPKLCTPGMKDPHTGKTNLSNTWL